MSDSVAVMKAGIIDQIASGKAIYDDPSTAFCCFVSLARTTSIAAR